MAASPSQRVRGGKERCPICGASFEKAMSLTLPFCSSRCRTIDLGRWLGEEYVVPGSPLDEDEENGFGDFEPGWED